MDLKIVIDFYLWLIYLFFEFIDYDNVMGWIIVVNFVYWRKCEEKR